MKRFLSFIILTSLAVSFSAPVAAIENTVLKAGTQKIKPTNNKYEYVNLDWWKFFNDEFLNGYIVKAVENNKDLKMATLTIDEYYQNIVMQRASELPSIQAGFMPGYGNFTGKSDVGMMLPLVANYEIDIFGKTIIKQLL